MNRAKRHVLVCDDDNERAERWRAELTHLDLDLDLEFFALGEDFEGHITDLEKRRRTARPDLQEQYDPGVNPFDEAAIALVDYDLVRLKEHDYLTGEIVCYLARCYSSCDLIIGINQFPGNAFDLTLRHDFASFADLNVSEKQMTNLGLWDGKPAGFRPWWWPSLPTLLDAFPRRVAAVLAALEDDPDIFTFLDLAANDPDALPRLVRQYVEGPTPGEFKTLRALAREPGFGLQPSDATGTEGDLARVLAARLSKWLGSVVLPTQDVLVDAPHLAQRNPALLRGDATNPASWEATTALNDPSGVGGIGSAASPHRYEHSEWLDRPAWRADRLRSDDDLPDPWNIDALNLVFCEDVSRFLPREEARQFVVDVSTSAPTRYIAADSAEVRARFDDPPIEDVEFRPASRLAR